MGLGTPSASHRSPPPTPGEKRPAAGDTYSQLTTASALQVSTPPPPSAVSLPA